MFRCSHFSFRAKKKREQTTLFEMPAGRKSGKSSTSGAGKAAGKQMVASSSKKATTVMNLEEDCSSSQQLNQVTEVEGEELEAKLSDISADEPDSSECEFSVTMCWREVVFILTNSQTLKSLGIILYSYIVHGSFQCIPVLAFAALSMSKVCKTILKLCYCNCKVYDKICIFLAIFKFSFPCSTGRVTRACVPRSARGRGQQHQQTWEEERCQR